MPILRRVPRRWQRIGMVVLAGASGVSCGSSGGAGGPVTNSMIGPQGGSAASVDGGARVTVPVGALTTDLAITVGPAAAAPLGAAGPAFDFGPNGTLFALPVELRLSYDPAALPVGIQASQLRLGRAAGGVWEEVDGSRVDEGANQVIGQSSSFSIYAPIVPGLMILPPPVDGFGEVKLTAYVVDAPAAGVASEFRELQPAIAWLTANLLAGQQGRILVRTRRHLTGGAFALSHAIKIEPDESSEVTVDGSSTFTSAGDLSLRGIVFGSLTVFANGQVTLFDDQVSGVVDVNLGAAGGGRSGRAESLGATIRSCSATADLTVNALADVSGDVVVEGTTTPAVHILGTYAGNAEAKISACPTQSVQFEAGLKGSAKGRVESLSGLDLLDAKLQATGTNAFEAEEVVTGDFRLSVEDAGELTVRAKSVTAQKADYQLGASKVDVRLEDTVTGEVSWAGGSADGVSAEVTIDQNGGRAEAAAKLISHDNANVTLGVRNYDFQDKVDIVGDGELHVDLSPDVTVGANLTAILKDVSTVGIDHGEYKGGVYIEAKDTARLSFSAKGSIHDGRVAVFPANGAFVDVTVTDEAVMKAGGVIVDTAGSLAQAIGGIFRGETRGYRRPVRPSVAGTRGRRQAGEQIVIRNVHFTEPTNVPPVSIFGVEEVPVTVEDCTFDGLSNLGIVMGEVNSPVTITHNTCAGGGIGLDGDIEGEGGSGSIFQPYLIQANTVTTSGPGITAQDLSNVTIRQNTVSAMIGITVSASTARLEQNTITASLALSMAQNGGPVTVVRLADGNSLTGAILVAAGAFLNAEGNTIVGPVTPSSGGYIRLVGNSMAGSFVGDSLIGGLLNDPVPANSGLTGDDIGSAIDFNGNGCQDYPGDCDGPSPETCCPGIPVPHPALPLGF